MAHKLAEDPFKRKCNVTNYKKPLVLSKDQTNRIKSHAQPRQTDAKILEEKRKRREACKELTEAYFKKPEAGLELRKMQYARDVECVHDDKITKDKLQRQKNIVLNKAYERLYKHTDRVKYFKSAKDFCEMMKQRDEQVAAKAALEGQMAEYDAQFLLGQLKDVDRFKDEEKEKEKTLEENKKKNAANWTKQHLEVLRDRDQECLENLREGIQIYNEVVKEKEKAKEKSENEKQANKNYKNSLDEQINNKLLLLEMRQQLEDAEDERAKIFNEAKREMLLEHKKIKADLTEKKMARQLHVANNMQDESKLLRDKDESSLQKAILQADDKARLESEKKIREREEMQEAIKKFHEDEKARKEKQEYEDKLNNFKDKRALDDLVDKLLEAEDAKQKKHHQLLEKTQHIQLHQIEARKIADKSDEIKNLDEYLCHMRGLDKEEEMFQKYAQKEIEECEKRGVNTYAMKKAARPGVECGKGPLFKDRGHIRPRYYASGAADDLGHMERKSNQTDTKQRLGFML